MSQIVVAMPKFSSGRVTRKPFTPRAPKTVLNLSLGGIDHAGWRSHCCNIARWRREG